MQVSFPKLFIRVESLFIFALSAFVYFFVGWDWKLFVILFLDPRFGNGQFFDQKQNW